MRIMQRRVIKESTMRAKALGPGMSWSTVAASTPLADIVAFEELIYGIAREVVLDAYR
jgi:uncharacterized membrane protein